MPELEETPDPGVAEHSAPPTQLHQYFSGIAGIPPKPERSQPVTLVAADGNGTEVLPTTTNFSPGNSDAEEINRLKRLLHEKDHAIFRAVLSESDLKQQLEDVRAESETLKTEIQLQREVHATSKHPEGLSPEAKVEIDRQRKEWLRIQKSLEREHAQRKAELVQVRGQWFQTQQHLEQETRARRMEAAQSSAKIATLERNLTTANTVISESRKKGKSGAKRGFAIAFASVVLIVALGAGWTQFSARASAPPSQTAGTQSVAAQTPTVQPAAVQPATVLPKPGESKSGPGTHVAYAQGLQQAGFQGSLSRLNAALTGFGNRQPEAILREVRQRSGDPSVCAFQWNNGQPALLFGSEGMKHTLASALGNCAAAVEKFRP